MLCEEVFETETCRAVEWASCACVGVEVIKVETRSEQS